MDAFILKNKRIILENHGDSEDTKRNQNVYKILNGFEFREQIIQNEKNSINLTDLSEIVNEVLSILGKICFSTQFQMKLKDPQLC